MLLKNNIPLKNYTVNFSYTPYDACEDDGSELYQSVKTDDDGKFTIDEKRRWSIFRMGVPADFYAHYNLCFVSPSGEKRWFFDSELRTPDWAAHKQLECEYFSLSIKTKSLEGKLKFEKEGCFRIIQ